MIPMRFNLCILLIGSTAACSNPHTNDALPITPGMYGESYRGFEDLNYVYLAIMEEKKTYTPKQLRGLLGKPEWSKRYPGETHSFWTYHLPSGKSARSLLVIFDDSGKSKMAHWSFTYI